MSVSSFLERKKLKLAKQVARAKEVFDLASIITEAGLHPAIETSPFPHIIVDNFFTPAAYRAIEHEFEAGLARGLSDNPNEGKVFHAFNIDYDGYLLVPPHFRFKESPLSVFYSIAWNAFFSELFGCDTSLETSMAFHHHPPGDSTGFVHHDFVDKYFDERARLPNLVIPHDETPPTQPPPPSIFKERRVIALLFYVANLPWKEGDGGETGLYGEDKVTLLKKISPTNNRMLAFSLSERSFHAFQGNSLPRNCIVQWFHIPEALL
jgi:hypothetical protein